VSNYKKILAIHPWHEGLVEAIGSATLRAWWRTTNDLISMTTLIGLAHAQGTLPRRRLVVVAFRCIEHVTHRVPPSSKKHLHVVGEWVYGGYVERDVWSRAHRELQHDLEAGDEVGAVRAAYADSNEHAAHAAKSSMIHAGHLATYGDAEICDVIRDEFTIDEVCAALYLNPDEGVTP
jgi:hypothetical protein